MIVKIITNERIEDERTEGQRNETKKIESLNLVIFQYACSIQLHNEYQLCLYISITCFGFLSLIFLSFLDYESDQYHGIQDSVSSSPAFSLSNLSILHINIYQLSSYIIILKMFNKWIKNVVFDILLKDIKKWFKLLKGEITNSHNKWRNQYQMQL